MIQCVKFYKRENIVPNCMRSNQYYQECIFNELKRDSNAFSKKEIEVPLLLK